MPAKRGRPKGVVSINRGPMDHWIGLWLDNPSMTRTELLAWIRRDYRKNKFGKPPSYSLLCERISQIKQQMKKFK
jgi:hypothetical protein